MLFPDSSHIRSVAVFRLSGAGFLGCQLLRRITLIMGQGEFRLGRTRVSRLATCPRTSPKGQQDRQQMGPVAQENGHAASDL